jgi:Helix-turn-helix domain
VLMEKLRPSIANDLRLKPQARAVLRHLERGLSISPLEAQAVYSVFRLAASINELRRAGYNIETELRQDGAGHRYARYRLVKHPAYV